MAISAASLISPRELWAQEKPVAVQQTQAVASVPVNAATAQAASAVNEAQGGSLAPALSGDTLAAVISAAQEVPADTAATQVQTPPTAGVPLAATTAPASNDDTTETASAAGAPPAGGGPRGAGGPPPAAAEEEQVEFDDLDTNEDGVVSIQEFMAGAESNTVSPVLTDLAESAQA